MNVTYDNTALGNGLLPPGSKPLPEPTINPVLCCHMASPGHNEFKHNSI